jgi:hypothetical protein
VGNTAVVAHEVMKAGMILYLGVEGCNADGTLVIPTTWAMCGAIEKGANTGEDLSVDPTLPVWNQLQVQIEQIKRDAITQEQVDDIQADVQAARSAAEAAAQRAEEAVGNGITPHIGADGNWWLGDADTGVGQRTVKVEENDIIHGVNLPSAVNQCQRAIGDGHIDQTEQTAAAILDHILGQAVDAAVAQVDQRKACGIVDSEGQGDGPLIGRG